MALSFLRGPMKAALSAGVWKRPWPNLEEVSMNLSETFSVNRLAVRVVRDFLKSSKKFEHCKKYRELFQNQNPIFKWYILHLVRKRENA